MLKVEGALVAGHAVEQHLQHSTQDTLLGFRYWCRLEGKGLISSCNRPLNTAWLGIYACFHLVWIRLLRLHTCTIISRVSSIIKLASVARLPSIRASCSSSALVLHRHKTTPSQTELIHCGVDDVPLSAAWASSHHINPLHRIMNNEENLEEKHVMCGVDAQPAVSKTQNSRFTLFGFFLAKSKKALHWETVSLNLSALFLEEIWKALKDWHNLKLEKSNPLFLIYKKNAVTFILLVYMS